MSSDWEVTVEDINEDDGMPQRREVKIPHGTYFERENYIMGQGWFDHENVGLERKVDFLMAVIFNMSDEIRCLKERLGEETKDLSERLESHIASWERDTGRRNYFE